MLVWFGSSLSTLDLNRYVDLRDTQRDICLSRLTSSPTFSFSIFLAPRSSRAIGMCLGFSLTHLSVYRQHFVLACVYIKWYRDLVVHSKGVLYLFLNLF